MSACGRIDILHNRRVLIVEDEYFIANDLWRSFVSHGAEVLGPVGTSDEAMALIDAEPSLDGVVLDINLNGRMAFGVAALLLERDVPFVFATGYDQQVVPERFAGICRCEKPVDPRTVALALHTMWADTAAFAQSSVRASRRL